MSESELTSLKMRLSAAEAVLREIAVPLETIVNLSYLAAHERVPRTIAVDFLNKLDEQAALIGRHLSSYFEKARGENR